MVSAWSCDGRHGTKVKEKRARLVSPRIGYSLCKYLFFRATVAAGGALHVCWAWAGVKGASKRCSAVNVTKN
jgi:hypothetical protein